jgi:hypothetical protein
MNGNIIWDPQKEIWLRNNRNIELSDIAAIIENEEHYAVVKNPAREGQYLYIIPYSGYTYSVPFVVDEIGTITIKTAYPNRKYHKQYSKEKCDGQ